MEINVIFWWILFGLDFLIYGLCCVLIIKRKTYTSISIRSPTLLLVTIVSNFIMSLILILYKTLKNNNISSFYYIFRLTMVLSMILRNERILKCCKTKKLNKEEEELDRKKFSEKKYLYQEKFYVRILIFAFILFLIAMIIIKLIDIQDIDFFYCLNYIYQFKEENFSLFKSQMTVWVIWNFIEQCILITYIFRTINKYIMEKIKTELLLFFILWYIYSFICTYMNYYFNDYTKKNDLEEEKEEKINLIIIILSLFFHYICLFINGYLPIILSYTYKTAISYHFSPKLMNNLYLFLTNEECYNNFTDYLTKTNNNKGIIYLKIYTHIMKYKLSFELKISKDIGLNDANEIYNTYFSPNNHYENYIDAGVLQKIRNECQKLQNNAFTPELFDEGLQFIFNELNRRFVVYHNTKEFKKLYEKIKLESYIQCKLCNTGLINKY